MVEDEVALSVVVVLFIEPDVPEVPVEVLSVDIVSPLPVAEEGVSHDAMPTISMTKRITLFISFFLNELIVK